MGRRHKLAGGVVYIVKTRLARRERGATEHFQKVRHIDPLRSSSDSKA